MIKEVASILWRDLPQQMRSFKETAAITQIGYSLAPSKSILMEGAPAEKGFLVVVCASACICELHEYKYASESRWGTTAEKLRKCFQSIIEWRVV